MNHVKAHLSNPFRSWAAFFPAALLAGCLSSDPDHAAAAGGRPKAADSSSAVRKSTGNGGWDDFPNKFVPVHNHMAEIRFDTVPEDAGGILLELASRVRKLPVPVGLRYSLGVSPDRQAGQPVSHACKEGAMALVQRDFVETGIFVADTLRYYGSAVDSGCYRDMASALRIVHHRHIIDPASGEAWERLEEAISNQEATPIHHVVGTGFVRLNNGTELEILSSGSTMLAPHGQVNAVITEGHLRLAWKAPYWMDLALASEWPFGAPDLFPADGKPASRVLLMTGVVRTEAFAIGTVELYSDRSVVIRDLAGRIVAP